MTTTNDAPLPQTDHENDCIDLVGGPFAVIESDPAVFTSLTRKLGIQNLELVEMYDIEPWAVDHLKPHGLIFCYRWRKDTHRPADFEDPAAERVWFANQLSDDACASHAIVNVLLNCPGIDIGDHLRAFKAETEQMSPVMKGLAITNSSLFRQAHNSLARPADLRASLNALAVITLDEVKAKAKADKAATATKRGAKPPPAKRAKTSASSNSSTKGKEKEKDKADESQDDDAYHFIGYVPAYGKVWELDGLKSGPLEVGELQTANESQSNSGDVVSASATWMDVVRPALRMKMDKYGGSAEEGGDIRFSLLAIVDGLYEHASDEFELLKKERIALERRLGESWGSKVDQSLLEVARQLTDPRDEYLYGKGGTFAKDFGARRLEKDVRIMGMSEQELISAWNSCITESIRAKVTLHDEITKAINASADHTKRTFDYEPFFRAFLERLQKEGLLNPLLDLDQSGNRIQRGRKSK